MSNPPAPSTATHPPQRPSWAKTLSAELNFTWITLLQEVSDVMNEKLYPNDDNSLNNVAWSCGNLLKFLRDPSICPEDTTIVLQLTRKIRRQIAGFVQSVLKRQYPQMHNGQQENHEELLCQFVRLSAQLFSENEVDLTETLLIVLDENQNYYTSQYDHHTRRNDNGRVELHEKFIYYMIDKYPSIVQTLCSTPFIGVDNASAVLNLLNKLGPNQSNHQYNFDTISSQVAHASALQFMNCLKECTENDLKMRLKKNEKSLEPLWFQLEKLCGHPNTGRDDDDAPWFWMEHIDYKYFTTDNLQQRMFAIGEFTWWSTVACNSHKKRRFLKPENYIVWLNEHQIFENLFTPSRMHPEVLRRAFTLLQWLAMRQHVYPTCLPMARLSILWNAIVTSPLDISTVCMELLVTCLCALAEEMMFVDFLKSIRLNKTSCLFVSKLLAAINQYDTNKLSNEVCVETSLNVMWRLMWPVATTTTTTITNNEDDNETDVGNERETDQQEQEDQMKECSPGSGDVMVDEDEIKKARKNLLKVFSNVMKCQTSIEYRSQYVKECLYLIQSEDDTTTNDTEGTLGTTNAKEHGLVNVVKNPKNSRLAFRLLQTIVNTMDFIETNTLVESQSGFLEMLINEYKSFTTNTTNTTNATNTTNTTNPPNTSLDTVLVSQYITMKEGINERIKFLSLILRQSSTILTDVHVLDIYNTMPIYCTDMFWKWLQRLAVNTSCMDPTSTRSIFVHLFNNAAPDAFDAVHVAPNENNRRNGIQACDVTEKGWSCFETMFVYVNATHVTCMHDDPHQIYWVDSVDLLGIDFIWKIATEANLSIVAYHVSFF